MDANENRELQTALAALAKAGNKAALGQLWELNKSLLHVWFWRWYAANKEQADAHGITIDDLDSEGFFATEYAVRQFDPSKGFSFTTYLKHAARCRISHSMRGEHVRNVTTEDGRRRQLSGNPINYASSLDVPIDDEDTDGATVGDMQADPAAEQEMLTVEESIDRQHLRAVLDAAIDRCGQAEGAVVRHRFYEGLSLASTGGKMGLTPAQVRSIESRALRTLRRDAKLRKWHDQTIESRAWHSTSFSSWANGGSVQETAVEYAERMETLRAARYEAEQQAFYKRMAGLLHVTVEEYKAMEAESLARRANVSGMDTAAP